MVKILKTLRYIFIISLILTWICFNANSQPLIVQPAKRTQSIALGVDLAPFIIKTYNKDRTGIILTGRYGLKDKIFAVGEIGFENIDFFKSKIHPNTDKIISELNYKSNGSFLKFGLDYNLFRVDEPGNNDNVLVGIRYGLAYQEQNSSGFTIGNGYWDDYLGSTSIIPVTSHWMEFIFGLRTELFRNFYMGWSVRAKLLLFSQNKSVMDPYAIPGLGKVNNGFGFGFGYSLEYQIPFGKKNTIARQPE